MLRISIIGNWANIDDKIDELNQFPNCILSGYYNGITGYKNILEFVSEEELIANSDACIILNTNESNHFFVEKLIRNQISCFLESPFAPSLDDAKRFVNLLHEAQVIAQVSNPDKYNDAFTATLSHFNQPMFIESSRLASLTAENKDLSVVLNLMIHDIDILLTVVKSEVKKVQAIGVPVLTNTPDIVNARIEFENGCVANLTASRVSLSNEHKARFFQRDSYISVDYLNRTSSIFELSNRKKIKNNTAIPVDLGLGEQKYIYVHSPQATERGVCELEHFINSVYSNTNEHNFTRSLSALEVAYRLNEKIEINHSILV